MASLPTLSFSSVAASLPTLSFSSVASLPADAAKVSFFCYFESSLLRISTDIMLIASEFMSRRETPANYPAPVAFIIEPSTFDEGFSPAFFAAVFFFFGGITNLNL